MKFKPPQRSLLIAGILVCFITLAGTAVASAQDEKGTVNSFAANMATTTEMLKLCGTWNVTGCCGWSGTWYRRPNTNIFDTKWKHTNGTPVTFVVELLSWNKSTQLLTWYQAGNKGTYWAYLTNNGTSIVRGTTSFYPAGATWSATAVLLNPGEDEKGRVLIPR